MRITVDIEDVDERKLLIEAQKDGHENRSAIVRKATSFFLHHVSQRDVTNSDVSLSPAVFDDLKKAYSKKGKIHQGFADTIIRLGIEEYKRIRKAANN